MVKRIRAHLAIVGDKPANLSLAARHCECKGENTVRLMAAILELHTVSETAADAAGVSNASAVMLRLYLSADRRRRMIPEGGSYPMLFWIVLLGGLGLIVVAYYR